MSNKQKLRSIWGNRFVRFACVGTINTLTDLAILNGMIFWLGLATIPANCIAGAVSISLAYLWNRKLVFSTESSAQLNRFIRFVIVTASGVLFIQSTVLYFVGHAIAAMPLTSIMTALQAHIFEVNAAKLSAIVAAMTWNFMLYRTVVFKVSTATSVTIDEQLSDITAMA